MSPGNEASTNLARLAAFGKSDKRLGPNEK